MNRRFFLSRVAAAGVATGLVPAAVTGDATAATASGSIPPGVMPAAAIPGARVLSRTLFADALNARFAVDGDEARRLELVDLEDAAPAKGLEQFSVVFRELSAPPRALAAGIRELSHPAFGRIDLYLEPAADDVRGLCYHATVCLLS